MQHHQLDPAAPHHSVLRRVAGRTPVVLGVYAAASLALGFGFADPLIDAVGFTSTAIGFAAGDAGIRRITRLADGLG